MAGWLVGWLAAATLNLQDTFIARAVCLWFFGFCGLNAFDKFRAFAFAFAFAVLLVLQSLLF